MKINCEEEKSFKYRWPNSRRLKINTVLFKDHQYVSIKLHAYYKYMQSKQQIMLCFQQAVRLI